MSGNRGDVGDLVFKTSSAVNQGVYTIAETKRLKSDNTIEISASSTTLKSLMSNDASVDTSINNKLGLLHTAANGYTAFDANIFLGNTSGYRPYYMGLLGDQTNNTNVFCIASVGGGEDGNPDPVFAVNENGNGEFAARCAAPLFVDGGTNDLRTDIESKQPALTVGAGINIASNTISFNPASVTSTVNFSCTGVGIVAAGSITAGTNLKYTDTNGVVQNVEEKINGKQDALTIDSALSSTSTNPVQNQAVHSALSYKQDNLTIDSALSSTSTNPVENKAVHSALNSITFPTYTAESGGGIAVNSSREISLDLSSFTTTQTPPQPLEIIFDTTPQLLITGTSETGEDAQMILRGRRNGSTNNNHAELRFENYDEDLSGFKPLGSIIGRVSDAGNNYGGLLFNNFADGVTRTCAMNMSSDGNFNIGNAYTFQNDYKLKMNGTINTNNISTNNSTIVIGNTNQNGMATASNSTSFVELQQSKVRIGSTDVELYYGANTSQVGSLGMKMNAAGNTTFNTNITVNDALTAIALNASGENDVSGTGNRETSLNIKNC